MADQPASGPLALPMTMRRRCSRRRGSRSTSRATARMSTSGALSGWMRPTNSTTCASWSTPSRSRDWSWSQGWNVCRSTPGGTTATCSGRAPYARTRSAASSVVLAVRVSAPATICDSPERAQVRLPHAAGRAGAVLDVGHRVHRVHQRQAVAAAEHEPGHARQPVVAVHEVVRRRHRLHPLRELRHQVGELLLGDRRARSGGHVQDAQVVGDLDHRVGRAAVVAGEDVDVQAALAEAAGDLGDVDVQPAGVTHPGDGQGRGVQADHGDAARVVDGHVHAVVPVCRPVLDRARRGWRCSCCRLACSA